MTRLSLLATSILWALGAGIAQAKPSIALILKDLNNPFFQEMREGALAAARDAQVNLAVVSSDNENAFDQQTELIERFVKGGVDLLLIAPNDPERLRPAFQSANRAKVPIILLDVPFEEHKPGALPVEILAQVYSDNLRGGELAAQYIAKNYSGPTRVGLLEGRLADRRGTKSREEGFLTEIAKYSQLTLAFRAVTNWDKKNAKEIVSQWLKDKEPPTVIFGCSDFLVSGALEAIAAGAPRAQIGLIGYDATREAQRNILQGRQSASIAQDPSGMGRIGVEYAAKHLKGEKIPKETPIAVTLVYAPRTLQYAKEVR